MDVRIDAATRILLARYSGEVTLQDRMVFGRRILAAAGRSGIYRWLLDFRRAQARSATPAEVEVLVQEFAPSLPPWTRMAYLLTYDHQLDASIEARLRDRGIMVERFHAEPAALGWLQSPVPDRANRDIAPAAGGDQTLRILAAAAGSGGLPPERFLALGQLVRDLLDAGLDEAQVRDIVRRMSDALRAPPPA